MFTSKSWYICTKCLLNPFLIWLYAVYITDMLYSTTCVTIHMQCLHTYYVHIQVMVHTHSMPSYPILNLAVCSLIFEKLQQDVLYPMTSHITDMLCVRMWHRTNARSWSTQETDENIVLIIFSSYAYQNSILQSSLHN